MDEFFKRLKSAIGESIIALEVLANSINQKPIPEISPPLTEQIHKATGELRQMAASLKGTNYDTEAEKYAQARAFFDSGPVSREQAEAALQVLTKYYRKPVLPLNRFCDAIIEWSKCIEQGVKDAGGEKDATDIGQQGAMYSSYLRKIIMDIRKSNLLSRLIYGGEKVRTQKCPLHNGHWSGLEHPDRPCPHGCGLTGWLKEP